MKEVPNLVYGFAFVMQLIPIQEEFIRRGETRAVQHPEPPVREDSPLSEVTLRNQRLLNAFQSCNAGYNI